MATALDKFYQRLAEKTFDSLYEILRRFNYSSTSDGNGYGALDVIKPIFLGSRKRPLKVSLTVPESCDKFLSAWDQVLSNSVSTKELITMKLHGKRLLAIVENILLQHEKLTREAIKTLRMVRLVLETTTVIVVLVLSYIYLKRSHGYLLQTSFYQNFLRKRFMIFIVVSGLSLTTLLCKCSRRYLRNMAFIS